MNTSRRDPDCIFCKIIEGRIPCSKVYEDDLVLAFLDINPLAEGHTLVIPKDHVTLITDMSAERAAEFFERVPRLAQAVKEATASDGMNLLQSNGRCAGQVIDHVHIHLIPRTTGDSLGFRWKATTYGDGRVDEVLRKIVEKISR
jgi:histidine triad (HIT) family protein